MAKVPFPYIDGLPQRAREQIYRDFEAIPDPVSGSAGEWDAVVDNLGPNDPANLQFNSIHEAINYCGGTAGLTRVRILVRNNGTVYSETVATSPGTLTEVFVYGEGGPPGFSTLTAPSVSSFANCPTWRVAAATAKINLTGVKLTLMFLKVEPSVVMSGTDGLFYKLASLSAAWCSLNGTQIAPMFNTSGMDKVSSFYAFGCYLAQLQCRTAGQDLVWCLYNCGIHLANTTSKNWADDRIQMTGCNFAWQDGMTISVNATQAYLVGCSFRSKLLSSSGTSTLTLSFAGGTGSRVHLTGAGTELGAINIAAVTRPEVFHYDLSNNESGSLILPAYGTPPSIPATTIRGMVGSLDVPGPAHIECSVHGGAAPVALRGPRISARLDVGGNGTAGSTVVKCIALTDSHVVVTSAYAGANAVKAYDLDGTSNRNMLDFSGQSTFPTASTNTGAGNVIRVT